MARTSALPSAGDDRFLGTTGQFGDGADIHGIGDMPGHLIRRLHQVSVAHFTEATKACGLTSVQYATLVGTHGYPGIDQRSLAGLVALDRSTIGDVVNRLEQRGLLRREDNRTDRRAKHVFVTRDGREAIARMDPLVLAAQSRLLAPLSEGERAILMFLLHKLARLSNDSSPAPMRPVPPARPLDAASGGGGPG